MSDDNMSRGKNQVMYNFPPGTTFSNPKHDLIEKSYKMYGDELELSSEKEVYRAVVSELENWDGGVEQSIPAPVADRWAIIDPEKVLSEVFPRVFECMGCGRVHDYSGDDIRKLERNGLECQNPSCDGTLTQIHHVGVCPSCSNIRPIDVPQCPQHKDKHIKLDDSSDRYKGFRWLCDRENHNNSVLDEDFQTYCDCGQLMDVTVHSSSKATNIHDMTRVDLGREDIYHGALHDEDEIDPLVVGAYLGEFDHPNTTLQEIIQQDGIANIDSDDIDTDDPKTIEAAKQMLSKSLGGGQSPDLVRASVRSKVDSVTPSTNMRRYVQLQERMELDTTKSDATAREKQLMDDMGIMDLSVTSEFPLLKSVYGYHRTYEDQEEDGPEPSIRLFPSIKIEEGEYRIPIYTTKSKTEAVIFELDPRKVGHWLSEAGYAVEDTKGMDVEDARTVIYNAMDPIEPYETDFGEEGPYDPITEAIHRLIHTVSHLLLQRAAVHSGIDVTSFAEYLFTEGLAGAIYANNAKSYTAGGLFTLVDRNLEEWLSSTLREGERCVYDPTCANIRGGACHACLHVSEIGCQHFNKNLSRISLYGERIASEAPDGYWELTGGLQ